MPIQYFAGEAPHAAFTASCAAEEADALLEWMRGTTAPVVDLSACVALHTALAQLILATRPRVVASPSDPLLAGCLGIVPMGQTVLCQAGSAGSLTHPTASQNSDQQVTA
jgi:hypothetical protein